jgi:hypothetical protein
MFTPITEGRLTSLELALALFSGTDRVVAEILTNVSNRAESFANSGTSYWLRVGRGDVSTDAGWKASSLRVLAVHWVARGSDVRPVEINQLAAFRLNGETTDPIPEPGTMLLVGSALAMAAARRRGRAHANTRNVRLKNVSPLG